MTIPTSLSISHDYNHVTYYSTVRNSCNLRYTSLYITWLSYPCYIFIWNAVQKNSVFFSCRSIQTSILNNVQPYCKFTEYCVTRYLLQVDTYFTMSTWQFVSVDYIWVGRHIFYHVYITVHICRVYMGR